MNIYFKKLYLIMFLSIAGFLNPDHLKAQTGNTSLSKDMELRGLESRRSRQEPWFIKNGSGRRWQGFFFGVGFNELGVELESGGWINNFKPTENGIAFNLGFLDEEKIYEYERQISILDRRQKIQVGTQYGNRLEVIKNTLAYFWFPKLMNDIHAQVGLGIQSSRTRLAAISSPYKNYYDTALNFYLGSAYYLTSNFLVILRFSASRDLGSKINGQEMLLKKSHIRSIFLNYFFPL